VLWKMIQVLLSMPPLSPSPLSLSPKKNTAATTTATEEDQQQQGDDDDDGAVLKTRQQQQQPVVRGIVVYTVDEPSPTYREDLLRGVERRFSIRVVDAAPRGEGGDDGGGNRKDGGGFTQKRQLLSFVHLHEHRRLLEASRRFSLAVESAGTARLAFRGLLRSLRDSEDRLADGGGDGNDGYDPLPDVFVDTTGCAFTYAVARLVFGCKVAAYVHYPTISTDMLQLVYDKRRRQQPLSPLSSSGGSAGTSSSSIGANKNGREEGRTRSSLAGTYAKLAYYLAFALAYGAVGSLADVVLANSTWTYEHVRSLWFLHRWCGGGGWTRPSLRWKRTRGKRTMRILYPPCNVTEILEQCTTADAGTTTTTTKGKRQPVVLSIGQFRPEKDHVLQLEAFAVLLKKHPDLFVADGAQDRQQNVKLVVAGSCRGPEDERRLQMLRDMARSAEFGLPEGSVEFVVNQPYSIIREWLSKASVGIHTVRSPNEQLFQANVNAISIIRRMRSILGLFLRQIISYSFICVGLSDVERTLWDRGSRDDGGRVDRHRAQLGRTEK